MKFMTGIILFVKVPPQTSSQVSTPCLSAILCNCVVVVLQRRIHIHKHVVGAATTTIYKGTNIYEFKHGITTVVQQRYYQEATTTSKHNIERASLFFLNKNRGYFQPQYCKSFFVFLKQTPRRLLPSTILQ
jgi:hypothetical protein